MAFTTPTKSTQGPCPYAPTKPELDAFSTPTKPVVPESEQLCPPGPGKRFKDNLIMGKIEFDDYEQSDPFKTPKKPIRETVCPDAPNRHRD
jgi:hypothetical protein